jgi:hypothetical protein
MTDPVLLDYIRQNLGKGISRSDIEAALLAARWSTPEITEGFEAIEHPEASATSTPAARPPHPSQHPPPTSPADDNAAEVARIEEELAREAQRQKWRGATTSTPVVGGIIGWLIARKVVSDELQANEVLIGIVVGAIVLSTWLLWPKNDPEGAPTPAELQEMQMQTRSQ